MMPTPLAEGTTAANSTNLTPPVLGDASGHTCSCPDGHIYFHKRTRRTGTRLLAFVEPSQNAALPCSCQSGRINNPCAYDPEWIDFPSPASSDSRSLRVHLQQWILLRG
jgi:hypothetical protein